MTEVGSVYGKALYELAKDESLSQTVSGQLRLLQESFRREPDFILLLSSPNLTKAERCGILDDSFRDQIHIYILNFMKILTEKGYMRHFSDCCDAFFLRYNRDNGILPVTAITAVALSQEQAQRLSSKLSKITGNQIQLHNRIDAAIIGGVRLDYDGKCLDDTLAHRLDAIRDLLKNTIL